MLRCQVHMSAFQKTLCVGLIGATADMYCKDCILALHLCACLPRLERGIYQRQCGQEPAYSATDPYDDSLYAQLFMLY